MRKCAKWSSLENATKFGLRKVPIFLSKEQKILESCSEMCCTEIERESVIGEKFIKTLKNAISNYVYIYK